MNFKKFQGKIYGVTLSPKEQAAVDAEINRQTIEADRRYTNDIDALVLYVLHKHLGFGKKRLRRFWEAFSVEHDKLVAYYEMPKDGAWLADHKLKEIGVDVAAWNAEKEEKATQ